VIAVLRKELVSYFSSLLAYVVVTLFLGVSGFYFYSNLSFFLLSGGFDVARGLWQYQLHDMRQIMLTLLPLLTMRLFAEERRLGTLELLWTYPLRDVEIVLGKYLASLLVLLLMLLPTLAFPALLLQTHTSVAIGPLLAGYLGLFLLGAAFLACGILVADRQPGARGRRDLHPAAAVLGDDLERGRGRCAGAVDPAALLAVRPLLRVLPRRHRHARRHVPAAVQRGVPLLDGAGARFATLARRQVMTRDLGVTHA
jgi:hypothetical protein